MYNTKNLGKHISSLNISLEDILDVKENEELAKEYGRQLIIRTNLIDKIREQEILIGEYELFLEYNKFELPFRNEKFIELKQQLANMKYQEQLIIRNMDFARRNLPEALLPPIKPKVQHPMVVYINSLLNNTKEVPLNNNENFVDLTDNWQVTQPSINRLVKKN